MLAILILFVANSVSAAEPPDLLTSWLNAQTNIRTWSADVVQTRTFKSQAQPLTATGQVWFAAPNRFRWEITQPLPTIAVRNGDELLVITPRLKRVERFPLAGNQTGMWRDALALLEAGFPRSPKEIDARFKILAEFVKGDVCEVTLEPKAAGARKMIPQIKVAFDTKNFSLRATQLQFADGSLMRNDFTNSVLNPKIDEALFTPKIESDFKVVEPFKR